MSGRLARSLARAACLLSASAMRRTRRGCARNPQTRNREGSRTPMTAPAGGNRSPPVQHIKNAGMTVKGEGFEKLLPRFQRRDAAPVVGQRGDRDVGIGGGELLPEGEGFAPVVVERE